MNIPQSLVQLGLDEKQADLYTYLLKQPKNGSQTAFIIAQNTGLPRSTVYVLLEQLEEKQLVSSFKKNNVLHYLTASPSRLMRDLDEKKDLLSSLIPTLENLAAHSSSNPSVQTFTGKNGVKIVFDDVYDPKQKGAREVHTFSHPKLLKYVPRFLPQKLELKKKMGIFGKVIVPGEFENKLPTKYQSDSHRETRFLPNHFSFDGTLMIYRDKTAIISFKGEEVISMIIDSPAITQMIDAVFQCLWGMLEKKGE